ncbi:MAG TPA: hypothetical protein VHO28_04825 [Ignavibacteriales bacterium]|nr:hypothetical protein [Ignavibacteriales bacterium]
MKKQIDVTRVAFALNILGYVFLLGGIVASLFVIIRGGGNFGVGMIVNVMTFILWGLTASALTFFLSRFIRLFASTRGKPNEEEK